MNSHWKILVDKWTCSMAFEENFQMLRFNFNSNLFVCNALRNLDVCCNVVQSLLPCVSISCSTVILIRFFTIMNGISLAWNCSLCCQLLLNYFSFFFIDLDALGKLWKIKQWFLSMSQLLVANPKYKLTPHFFLLLTLLDCQLLALSFLLPPSLSYQQALFIFEWLSLGQ